MRKKNQVFHIPLFGFTTPALGYLIILSLSISVEYYKDHLSTTSGYFIEVEHVHSLAMAWVFVTTIRWRYQWEQTFPSSYCANTGSCTGNTESHGIERTDWSRKETKWDIMTFEAYLWEAWFDVTLHPIVL